MANILLVDDEIEIIELIEIYLENNGHNVYKYTCPKDVLKNAELSKIDLAVLDVMMPEINGFTLCRQIRKNGFIFPVIMLTAKDEDADKINGLALGADDYMVKPFNPLELMARINAQLRRFKIQSGKKEEEITNIDINGLMLCPKSHKCLLYDKEILLTPTEFSILLLLAQNKGKVISSEEIFESIWGEKYLESNNTVMVHIQKLRKKLNDTGKNKKFIQTVWGVGYKIEE